jgi:endonuclease/exonuclease/phosphatase family metal-dependent hydrolase
MKLSVLSYNIHKGFSHRNKKFTLQRIKAALQNINADIVFLQEVVGQNSILSMLYDDWPSIPQYKYLAENSWEFYYYGQNANYTNGHHGNAILSKYRFIKTNNINISTNRFEQRGLIDSIIDFKGRQIHCFCVHLNLLAQGRKKQLETIGKAIQTATLSKDPFILAGDFNDWSKKASDALSIYTKSQEVFKALHGAYAKTYPAALPVLSLDRIYVRGITPLSSKLLDKDPWNKLSDHVGIYCEMKID